MRIPHYLEILKEIFNDQIHFIDIGAYQGSVTDNLLKNFPKARGILFEPTEISYNDLKRKFSSDHRIKIENISLGAINEERPLFQFDDPAQNSILSPTEKTAKFEVSKTKVETLDSYLSSTDFLNKIDFIKIDTQGNDLAVMKGSMETIKNFAPIILTECIFFKQYESQGSYYDQINLMNEYKYKLVGIVDAHYNQQGLLAFADLLFVPESLFNSLSKKYVLGEKFNSFDVYHLFEQNTFLQKTCEERIVSIFEKEKLINTLSDDLIHKEILISSQNVDLLEKDKEIANLSVELKEREKELIDLVNILEKRKKELYDKEKQIAFLSTSLTVLKKRLSSPIWGIITLFQHHFPSIWEFIYKKVESFKKRKNNRKYKSVENKNKLKFFEPRLGKLFHHDPIEIRIPQNYYKIKNILIEPKISIVTPSFNQGNFISKTIESVLSQNYSNLEYLIQDSCSADETKTILGELKNSAAKCFVEKDYGQANAINRGFSKSSGDIMAWINSDDCYLPGALNYVVNYFNRHQDIDVVYGHRVLIDENDREIGRWILPRHDKKVLHYADFIPQETLFWRREIWEKTGSALNEEFNFALDWDLLLRFQKAGAKIVRLPRFLASFRVHPQQKTSAQISSLGEFEMNRIRKEYLNREVNYDEVKKNIYFYLFKSELLNKLYDLKIINY